MRIRRSQVRNHLNRGLNKLSPYLYLNTHKTEEILGCTLKEFNIFLKKKVDHWNNTWGLLANKPMDGKLVLDHIKPLSLAKNKADVEALSHYTNFQLIWKHVNHFKSDRWSTESEQFWSENIYLNPRHKNLYVPESIWRLVFPLLTTSSYHLKLYLLTGM